jgi:hypothetical protein
VPALHERPGRLHLGTNHHCYSRYNGKLAWDDAERTCERDDAHLVAYTSDAETRTANVCTATFWFVCEEEPWILRPTDNHAYRIFYQKVPFTRAREICAMIGAHLATLTDAEEDGFVSAQFYGVYWIGAWREAMSASFQCFTAERFAYSNLLPGEPNVTGAASCLVVGDDHKWRDRMCTETQAFVCEHD